MFIWAKVDKGKVPPSFTLKDQDEKLSASPNSKESLWFSIYTLLMRPQGSPNRFKNNDIVACSNSPIRLVLGEA
ncbi:hypothetical protein Pyn_10303 [Prunus yedoensis var. nudiflora]|uniref:Uncharacterized protein n=1 Tax=Prunus yedoensis var. nudiflora TaxID=2094558 RepID=A0A314YE95_PRUYE|nr:hypothetical protein Pyn_10303 [Prunus yedoensis var. nudiflora]